MWFMLWYISVEISHSAQDDRPLSAFCPNSIPLLTPTLTLIHSNVGYTDSTPLTSRAPCNHFRYLTSGLPPRTRNSPVLSPRDLASMDNDTSHGRTG